MEYRSFGNTGIEVSVAGLGAGGVSRLGRGNGTPEAQAIKVVHRALELGVNFFDTAAAYRTEDLLGRALGSHRPDVVLCSKVGPRSADGSLLDRSTLRTALELALTKLNTDYLDVYMLHRVRAEDYEYCSTELYEELATLRGEGKLRAIGLTESTSLDVGHRALQLAVRETKWDVVMVAFNLFNQSAREAVVPGAVEHNAAVVVMGAALSRHGPYAVPEEISDEVARLEQEGRIGHGVIDPERPFAALVEAGLITSSVDAAYRFIAYEPGVSVILIGTSSVDHLEANIRSVEAGPLAPAARQALISTFSGFEIARA